MLQRVPLLVGSLLSVHLTTAIFDVSVAPPFQSVSLRGSRFLKGWLTGGNTKIKQGSVRLTADEPSQRGEMWTETSINLKDGFSFSSSFRLSSSAHEASQIGESLAWFFVRDARSELMTTSGDFYGAPHEFTGVAVAITPPLPGEAGEVVTTWVNDGSAFPRELGRCRSTIQYSERRDDFAPSLTSGLRLKWVNNRLEVQIDERGTQAWKPCVSSQHADLAKSANVWMSKAVIGIVATTQTRRNNVEIVTISLHEDPFGAVEEAPREEARPVRIVHDLEFKLFNVHETLTKTIEQLQRKAARDAQHIESLFAEIEQTLSGAFMNEVDARMDGLEHTLMDSHVKRIGERSSKIESVGEKMLNASRLVSGWEKIAIGIIISVAILAYYAQRQFAAFKKYNSRFM